MIVKTIPKSSSGGDIRDTRLADAISERYLSYAFSIIMSRSLPDVRDVCSLFTGGFCMPCANLSWIPKAVIKSAPEWSGMSVHPPARGSGRI